MDCSMCFDFYNVLTWLTVVYVIYILVNYARWNVYIKDYKSKCVLVTGCDSGFGLDLAQRLDRIGCHVYAGCYTQSGFEKLEKATSTRTQCFHLDVTSPCSVKEAYAFVRQNLEKHGLSLWGVVNNAGVLGNLAPCEFHSRQDFERVFQVNFFGMVEMVNTFLPLIKQSRGRIVNCSSIAAFAPLITSGFCCPYSPSKAAVYAFTKCLRYEKRCWGISASVVLPGGHKTDLLNFEHFVLANLKQWETVPVHVKEDYGEHFVKATNDIFQLISPLTPEGNTDVVNAYEHALFSKYPFAEYNPGIDTFFFWSIEKLPYIVKDRILDVINCYIPVPKALKKKQGKTAGISNGFANGHNHSVMNGENCKNGHIDATADEDDDVHIKLANRSGVKILFVLANMAKFLGNMFSFKKEKNA